MQKKVDALKRADYDDEVTEDVPDDQDASSEGSGNSTDDDIDDNNLPDLWTVESTVEEDPDDIPPMGAPGPGFKPFQMLPDGIGLAENWRDVDVEDMDHVFKSFFTDEMIGNFVTATNNFGVLTRIKVWKPMPVDE